MFMRVIARVVKSTPNEIMLRDVMAGLEVKFEYYKKKKGGGFRLPAFKGNNATKIMTNVEAILNCWPQDYQIVTRQMARTELFKSFNILVSLKVVNKEKKLPQYTNAELQTIIEPHLEELGNICLGTPIDVDRKMVISMWKKIFNLVLFVNNSQNFNILEFIEYGVVEKKDLQDKWYIICDDIIESFVKCHSYKDCSIYLHILLSHGLDMYNRFGPLNKISNQGFENANKRDVQNFFSHTQRNGGIFLKKEEEEALSISELRTKRKSSSTRRMFTIPYSSSLHPSKKRRTNSSEIVCINNVGLEREFNIITRDASYYEDLKNIPPNETEEDYEDEDEDEIVEEWERDCPERC